MNIVPLDFEINPALITEGFTQSELQTWDNCSELWYLRYNLLLEKKGSWNWATMFGTWVHSAIEEFITTKGKRKFWNPEISKEKLRDVIRNQKWEQEREYYEKVGEVLMDFYFSHYKHDHEMFKTLPEGVEYQLDFKFEGFRLKGKIDWPIYHRGIKKNIISDHKSSGRLDKSIMLGWDFRFQFMFYLWGMYKQHKETKFSGFMPNALKKPQLRINYEKENINGFCARLREDISKKPENYFYRELMLLKAGDMQHFENSILMPKLARIRLLMSPKIDKATKMAVIRNKNTDHCVKYGAKYACQFIDLCKNRGDLNLPRFRQRTIKHTELEDESE